MLRSDFAKKMMSNSVAQGLNFGSRWLLNLALARHMLEAEFGLFSFVYMLANLFSPTIAFGVNFYLIHHAAQQQHIRHLLSSLLISLAVFVTLACGVIWYCLGYEDSVALELYLLSLAIGLCWALTQALFCYLKGRQQFAIEVRSQLVSAVLMLGLVLAIWFDWLLETDEVLIWLLLLSLVPLSLGLRHLWPELCQWQQQASGEQQDLWHWRQWRARLSYAWHDMFAIYLTNIPFIFLAIFSTLTALGQFRKAFILFMPVTLLPVVFSQVLLSKLSAQVDLQAKWQLFRRIMLWTFPLLSLPYVVLLLSYHWIYPWLLHEPLTKSTGLVTGLVVITLWLTLLKTYFEVWITSLGLNHWRAFSVTAVAFLSSLGYLWHNQQLNSVSAAWIFLSANLLAVTALLVLSWLGFRKLQDT